MGPLPENFKTHYINRLGYDRAQQFFESCIIPLRKSFRVNTLRYPVQVLREYAHKYEWTLSPIEWCSTGFFLERDISGYQNSIGNSIPHALGGMYVQEASSMIPVEALFHGHENLSFVGKKVGDLTASPGSKTTQIAEKMKGQGILLANELSSSRLKALYSNIERCGVSNAVITHYEAGNLCSLLSETFDFLLLDAPCTAEGTIRKDPNALKNWSPEDALRIANIQKKLIVEAFRSLKPGGEMVYSTCTLADEENKDIVNFLRDTFPESVEVISLKDLFTGAEKAVTSEGYLHVWPEIFDTEGFFVAKIKKVNSVKSSDPFPKGKFSSFPFEKALPKESQDRNQYFSEEWGCILPKHMEWWKRGREWWLFPEGIKDIVRYIKADRIGVKMGELHSKGWKTDYQCISCFGNQFTRNTYSVSTQEVQEVFQGKNLIFPCTDQDKVSKKFSKEKVIQYNSVSVSIGKQNQKGEWKNQLPRSLMRNLWG